MRDITQHGICARICVAALALSLVMSSATPGIAQITVAYVDVNVSGGMDDGSTWANAYDTLQEGLDDSSADQIWVKAGEYFPGTQQTDVFEIKNGNQVYGGFFGNEDPATFDLDDREFGDNETILSGDIDDDGLDAGNSQRVVLADTLTATTVLDGFTVTMGYADGSTAEDKHAAGLKIKNCTNFSVKNCVFEFNHADSLGGALRASHLGSSPTTSTIAIADCRFDDNEARDYGGAVIFYAEDPTIDFNVTVTDTVFNRNKMIAGGGAASYGGGLVLWGTNDATLTRVDFNDNFAINDGGALVLYSKETGIDSPLTRTTTVTDCEFVGNGIYGSSRTKSGGAVWIKNGKDDKPYTFEDCLFSGNETRFGGAGIWAEARARGGTEVWNPVVNLTRCKFLSNKMNDDGASSGGGAVFLAAKSAENENDGTITGTWSDCDFVENEAERGGAAYIRSSGRVDIEDCRFVANTCDKAGGAIGVADLEGFGTVDVRICKSVFVSNTGQQGGAIHNHEGATTTMVNCVLAGNSSTKEGGGVFNSRHTGTEAAAEMYMHNCLIAGNEADGAGSDDIGGGVFNGLGSDPAIMELVHCTLIGNHAGYKYGGAVNESGDTNCRLKFYNCISRDNTSVSESDTFKNQLYHIDGYDEGDVNNFLAQGTLPTGVYTDSPTWTSGDPVFTDDATSATWTGTSTFDGTTGESKFTFSTCPGLTVGDLFQPDTSNPRMLVVSRHLTTPGSCNVYCWGKWEESFATGAIFDLHIDSSGSADEFGDTNYVPRDWCDLNGENGDTDQLPYDLGLQTREVNDPDCGVYEIQP